MKLNKAYNTGIQAFHYRVGLLENPYEALTPEWQEWRNGWISAYDNYQDLKLAGYE